MASLETSSAVNAYFQGLDPWAGADSLRGKIDVLHVKNVRRHDSARWDYVPRGDYSYEWTPLAEGDIDWPALIREVQETVRSATGTHLEPEVRILGSMA